MRDEQALRRPEFADGHRLTLGDGQEWTIPEPTIRLYPVVADDGSIEVGGGPSFGADLDRLMDATIGGGDVDDFERLRLQFRLAVALLGRNYDLAADDYRILLSYAPADPESSAMWRRINRILVGLPPDPDESPSPKA